MTEHDLPKITSSFCYKVRQIDQPQEILFQIFKRFEEHAAIITSGQLTGMIIIHMAHENGMGTCSNAGDRKTVFYACGKSVRLLMFSQIWMTRFSIVFPEFGSSRGQMPEIGFFFAHESHF